VVLVSLHGLIRGRDPELGRDADTGGQVQYVLDLARALAKHPSVERVELMTRQVLSTNVDHDYGEHVEQIADRAWIVRMPFGPHRYLRKESLWPYLGQFVDHALNHFRDLGKAPSWIHSHYADAGEVGLELAHLLGVPLVHTGHSLGRVKRQRLLDKGLTEEVIEQRYHITKRIAAEDEVLARADLTVASTEQEVREQYAMYDAAVGERIAVIPPGVDLTRFRPPRDGERFDVAAKVDRFLADSAKPMILAVQRPDERKNLATLIRAYGTDEGLRKLANLVLLIGTREDVSELPRAQRKVLTNMLLLIDRYDLYGSVAYPKYHTGDEVAEIYRLAASRRGVFVNPALTEPFGLTLIEAAASGLPLVATNDGGPQEIVGLCENGVLVDPLDHQELARGLTDVLGDRVRWEERSRAGVVGTDRHFSWRGHVERYLERVERLPRLPRSNASDRRPRMALADGLVLCDIDNTLIGDAESLQRFLHWLEEDRERVAFGVATGRVLERALDVLERWQVPRPDVLVTGVGSEIHYGQFGLVQDDGWWRLIDRRWQRDALRQCLSGMDGLELQPERDQRRFKLSYFVDPGIWPGLRETRRRIREAGLAASVIFSHHEFLDVLPDGASKGNAMHYLARRWGLAMDRILVAGDSGNDADMLRSGAQAVVVANHSSELRPLQGRDGVYFAAASYAGGILEGLRHYRFPPRSGK
jgi:sucrose-phosphate synthase